MKRVLSGQIMRNMTQRAFWRQRRSVVYFLHQGACPPSEQPESWLQTKAMASLLLLLSLFRTRFGDIGVLVFQVFVYLPLSLLFRNTFVCTKPIINEILADMKSKPCHQKNISSEDVLCRRRTFRLTHLSFPYTLLPLHPAFPPTFLSSHHPKAIARSKIETPFP